MRKNNIPCFEVNGKPYEIKRNRYLQAEFDEMRKGIEMTDEEQVAYAKEQEFDARLEKLRVRKDELYDKYLETFDEADEEKYNKALCAYNRLIDEAGTMESVSGKQRKQMLDMGEKLIIRALEINAKGDTIRTYDEAKSIWESFVEENGQVTAIQFVMFTMNYIIGGDEDIENPFITQAKAKAEQRANMKKGIAKAR
jgi:nucleoside-triphosphatase THEP1